MTPEQILRRKLAFILGEAVLNQVTLETERDVALSELKKLKEEASDVETSD